ncbi:Gfo/Idh/MocA family oxidoreductase [Nitratireductor mangrovi]|uniref:Gfo/Idh/MocA family oxidoreductase n=1 Tax=Nitratireductor mangrovi TaxID=2599600 RepID=A0A5B8KYH5_9HYPH|nr:Gfo/Idh/MocA family oxidoreductase [Nitratireductor mangrovi]QDZ00629.1 Gfo/Idh/MocA family oxidoreductase [Nitratireductor mangrovi]
MKKTRIAIVGLGMAVTPHARGLVDLAGEVEVAYAFSPSEARRKAFADKFAFPTCDSLDTILKDRSVDAVAVYTPANTHRDIGLACAHAGKHVLMEKPLDITTARAIELVEGCRTAGVKMGVVLQHRFRPAGVRLAEILAAGELGRIVGCSAAIRLWRPQSYYDEPGRGSFARDGGGVLISQGIHTLDLMLSLAGQVDTVTGFNTTTPVHTMETEDMVCAAIRFDNGAFGTIEATTAAYPGFAEEIVLTCEKGTARLTGTQLLVQFQDGGEETIEADRSAGGTGADPMAFPHDYHRSVMADFVAAIRDGSAPKVTGYEALKVHRLIDALIETGQTGKAVAVAR